MKTVRLNETAKIKMQMEGADRVFKQVPLSKNDGTPAFCFRVFTIEPGGHTPYHAHNFEHLNYVMSGKGALIDEHGTGYPLTAGDFAMVLPGEKHQFRNTSEKDQFSIICAVPNEYE